MRVLHRPFVCALVLSACGELEEFEIGGTFKIEQAVITCSAVTPNSTTINEGGTVAYTDAGGCTWLDTEAQPSLVAWDWTYDGNPANFQLETILCDQNPATPAPNCQGGTGSPCTLSGTTWTCLRGATSPPYRDSRNDPYTARVEVRRTDGALEPDSDNTVNVTNVLPNGTNITAACTDATFCDAASPSTLVEGAVLTFTGTFTDPGSELGHRLIWDFGDGNTVTCHNPSLAGDPAVCGTNANTTRHTYADNATYTVLLTVCDEEPAATYNCDTTPVSRNFTVIDSRPRIGAISQDVDPTTEAIATTFGAVLQAPASDEIVRCQWDWGDGSPLEDEPDCPGDGRNVTVSAAHTYADGDPTTYTVTLRVYDEENTLAGGAQRSKTHSVQNAAPVAGVLSVIPAGTLDEGQTFTLSGSFSDPASPDDADRNWRVEWDFDYDGTTFDIDATDSFAAEGTVSRNHSYPDERVYTIAMRVVDQDGGAGSLVSNIQSVTVTVDNVPPTVTIIAPSNAAPMAEGDAVTFQLEYDDPGPNDSPWEIRWTWDDGSPDDVAFGVTRQGFDTRTHVLMESGTMNVVARVTDVDSGFGEDTLDLTVTEVNPLINSFTATPSSGTEELTVDFTVDARSGAANAEADPITRYEWDFDNDGAVDRTTFVGSTTYTYRDNPVGGNSWTARVRVHDEDTTSESTVGVVVDNQAPAIVSVLTNSPVVEGDYMSVVIDWDDPSSLDSFTVVIDWGDNSTDTTISKRPGSRSASAVHLYPDAADFVITVTVTDDDGGQDTVTEPVTVVDLPPTITAVITNAPVRENGPARIWVIVEHAAPDTITYDFDWNGNGVYTDAGIDVVGSASNSSVFTAPDNLSTTVNVRVTDDDVSSDTDAVLVVWENVPPALSGVASAPAAPNEGDPVTVTVTASDVAGAADPLTYTFDFDNDGTPEVTDAATASAQHTYTRSGSYSVRVRVADGDGGSAEAVHVVTVGDVAPAIGSVANDGPVPEGSPITLTVTASDAGGDPLQYQFDWNADGTIDTVQSSNVASHVFRDDGSYDVTVRVVDDAGRSATVIHPVSIDNVDPAITAVPSPQDATEGAVWQYQLEVLDPAGDADRPSYRLLQAPAGMSVSSSGVVVWVPTYSQTDRASANPGRSHAVEVEADDGDGGVHSVQFTVTARWRDDDGDGMADSWESGNGLDPTRDDAAEDADGDGTSNLEEFQNASGGPFTPERVELDAPIAGAEVVTNDVTLVATNTTDADSASLSYTFQIFDAGDLSTALLAVTVPEQAGGATSVVLDDIVADDGAPDDDTGNGNDVDLADDQVYLWRARATDDDGLTGPWSALGRFFYNPANDAPSAPPIASPLDGDHVATVLPRLSVGNATDVDDTALTYRFDVYEVGSNTPIATGDGIAPGGFGITSWVVDIALTPGSRYLWSVRVSDDGGAFATSATSSFLVHVDNNPPTAPTLEDPAPGLSVGSNMPALVIANAFDADGDTLSYFFELDTSSSFGSAALQSSGVVAEGAGGRTSWTPAPLSEDTWYGWRVRAFDGTSSSEWAASRFFVDSANNPPGAPVPLDPTEGAVLTGQSPRLVVRNSVDPEGEALTYSFEIRANSAEGPVVASAADVPEGDGETGTKVGTTLERGVTFFWTARARDARGGQSSNSAPASFQVYQVPPGDGCGCAGAGAEGVWLALALGVAWRRRRSR